MEIKYELYDLLLGSGLPDDKTVSYLKEARKIDKAWDLVQLIDRIRLLNDDFTLYEDFMLRQIKRKAVRYYNERERYVQ